MAVRAAEPALPQAEFSQENFTAEGGITPRLYDGECP